MPKNIEISIIIPAYNEEEYLKTTLESITNSNYKNYEVIVVCDNCTDSTEKIAKEYANKVHNVNFKNISKNRNFGTKKSKGQILVFNDADTIISKNYLSEIKKAVEKGVEYGTAKWVSETESLFGKYFAWTNNWANKKHKTVAGNFFVIKKAFLEIKGFNENLKKGEDTDLGDRLNKKNKQFSFIDNASYMPSERAYKKGFIKFWVKSLYESWKYRLNKNKL